MLYPIENGRTEIYFEATNRDGEYPGEWGRVSYGRSDWAQSVYEAEIKRFKGKGYRQDSFIVEHEELHCDNDSELAFA